MKHDAMNEGCCSTQAKRSQHETEPRNSAHPLAVEIVDALQEVLPHASTFVKITDPLTGNRYVATRTIESHQLRHDVLEQMFSGEHLQSTEANAIRSESGGYFVSVPIDCDRTNSYLAAYSSEEGFPCPRDRAVLRMAAVAAQSALRRLFESDGSEADGEEHEAAGDINLKELMKQGDRHGEMVSKAARRAEYMSALGTLAAGLSHDLGNLLLPIRLRLATIETRLDSSRFSQDFVAIRSCLDSMQRLTHGLELFSLDPQQGSETQNSVHLHEWWSDVESFMRNALPKGVELIAEIPRDLPPIRVARHQLAQLTLNLVQNAGEAMQNRGHGQVRISAIRNSKLTPGKTSWIELCVEDNGMGMSDEVHARCIEPFFTTKTRSISTGLGLSLVHGIVNRAGGDIRIESTEGAGTRVKMSLPAASDGSDVFSLAAAIIATVQLRDERLLGFVTTFLEALGISVREEPGAPQLDSMIWITDDLDEAHRSLNAFLGDSERAGVLIGELDAFSGDHRIISLKSDPDRAGLSRALRRAAHQAREQMASLESVQRV